MNDTLLNAINDLNNHIVESSILDIFVAIIIAFGMSLIVALVYMLENKEQKYEPNFVQSLVLMGVIVTAVIKVVGYNLAGAFGLVGAVSIIRFRTRLSSTKDTAYMFLSIAIGLACGLHQYSIGIVITLVASVILILFWKTKFGEQKNPVSVRYLSVKVNDLLNSKQAIERILLETTEGWTITSVHALDSKQAILDYTIQLNGSTTPEELLQILLERSAGQFSVLRFDISKL